MTNNMMKFSKILVLSIVAGILALFLVQTALAATVEREILLEDQVALHDDGQCGRSKHGWLNDCNANNFEGSGPGGCKSSAVADGVGGCYFWEVDGVRVTAESTVTLLKKRNSVGKLTIYTAHYGGGTYKNERVMVFVNDKKIGLTDDNWCNKGPNCEDKEPHEKVFDNVEFKKGKNKIRFKAANNGGSVYVYKYTIEAEPVNACIPAIETCNGLDDDCDGNIDDGFNVGQQCIVGIGACQRTGQYSCNAQGSGTLCNVQPSQPTAEVCNNQDDDCDGSIDEGNVCGTPCIPTAEICDNVDNDCDGLIDEGLNCNGPMPPVLSIPDQNIQEDSGFNNNLVDLFQYAADADTAMNALSFSIVSQSNNNIVNCALDNNRYIDCTAMENKNGYSDITVSVSDGTFNVMDIFRVNVLPANDLPSISFMKGTSACEDQTTKFDARVFDVESAVEVKWDFGDGYSATGTEAKHVYKNKGTYQLTIKATDNNGGVTELNNDVKVVDCTVSNIEISNAFVDDYYAVRPGDDIDVYTKVKNIGNVNENIVVRARLENSGNIEDSVNFELNEKAAGRWNLLSLKVPYSAKKGEQVVKITAITSKETVVKYITFNIK